MLSYEPTLDTVLEYDTYYNAHCAIRPTPTLLAEETLDCARRGELHVAIVGCLLVIGAALAHVLVTYWEHGL